MFYFENVQEMCAVNHIQQVYRTLSLEVNHFHHSVSMSKSNTDHSINVLIVCFQRGLKLKMLRRKPTRLELKIDDTEEFESVKKELEVYSLLYQSINNSK